MASSSNQQPILLESGVPLSQSVIWRLQREFYAQRGLRAWSEDMVPQFITNNPFIAEIYAQIVFAFLRDGAGSRKDTSGPQPLLRILELGAGPGKFSYLFLQHLSRLMASGGFPLQSIRYCMTDCAESLIQAWRSNPCLSRFAESGILEFEVLEAGRQTQPAFLSSGQTASSSLVLIANYVFDSLPQDAFVIENSQIFEALVTTTREAGQQEPEKLSGLQHSFRNAALLPNRYEDPSWNAILEHYRDHLPAATVLFPCEALRTLRRLAALASGPLLVLAADKGLVHEEDLSFSQGPPSLELHASGQCFSQTVNFDAIARCFQFRGGEALLPDKHYAGLSLCGFLQGRPGDRFPATQAAYRASQAAFAPDDLFALLGWLEPHMDETTIPQILAILRLSRWDPVALMRLFPVLARQIRNVAAVRYDLRNAILSTWANHFPVTPADNAFAFQCGVLLLELRFFDDALPLFRASQQALGPSAATSYNLGLCAMGLGRTSEALAFMTEACNLDPNFEPARASRAKLEGG
jgi:tetratricopeptide (TPR) repeat protein